MICSNKHCFDFAKEGYVNLLPVQNKKSKAPGDSAEMIQSRHRFLGRGYYDGFATTLCDVMRHHSGTKNVLDIGCGEGYYAKFIYEKLNPEHLFGIDISKPAAKSSAKQLDVAHFSVASAFSLPFFDAQFDSAISVFSPIDFTEANRILAPSGCLFFCGPGPTHLHTLAKHIYGEAKSHEGNHPKTIPRDLKLKLQQKYNEKVSVAGEHLPDLLRMTPYYWHCNEEQKNALTTMLDMTIELDIYISVYEKQGF